MSREGMRVAEQHGQTLRQFPDPATAERALLDERDRALRALAAVPKLQGVLDYSAVSLKPLERWLLEDDRKDLFDAVGYYLGELLCRHAHYVWIVQEFYLAPGRYEICVRRGRGTLALSYLGRTAPLASKDSLHRKFQMHAA